MVSVPGGAFVMGSDHHYAEEAPAHLVRVDPFLMDETAVTNAEFAAFVAETGYVTVAERPLDPALYPGARPEMLVPGSLVFRMTDGPVDTRVIANWWHWTPGACWRAPEGPGSTLCGREDHPVVHIAYEDAEAYAAWAGKALPTEAEWERAARGGLEGAEFAWGEGLAPGGVHLANTWQGPFPWRNFAEDGFSGTSPVRSFAPNPFGLYEMCGNVWEWTTDWFSARHAADPAKPCCAPLNPRGPGVEASFDPTQPSIRIPRKMVNGGSFLCASCGARARARPGRGRAGPPEHPGDLGRRDRMVEPLLRQHGHDGLTDAQHRPRAPQQHAVLHLVHRHAHAHLDPAEGREPGQDGPRHLPRRHGRA